MNTLDLRSVFTAVARQVSTTCVAKRFAVSTDAAAPSRIHTNSSVPPLHKTASVIRGALHVVLVQNCRTDKA